MAGGKLARRMGLGALFVYGVGDILGTGIYALVGPVAAVAGSYLWLSFAVALTIAFVTALSYSEMCSRFPKSGGAAHFVNKAFSNENFGFLTGWLLLFVSIVSMATLSRAFYDYLSDVGVNLAAPIVLLIFLLGLALINFKGIQQSSYFNMLSTTVEVVGLILVLWAGATYLLGDHPPTADASSLNPLNVIKGAALAFYAFIGFEDLANVAEEAKSPERNLPRAILGSLGTAGALYLAIGFVAVKVAGADKLAEAKAPLTTVIEISALPIPVEVFSYIALFAVANTCLLNSITGSRLLYGLAEDGLVPKFFANVNHKTKTPFVAIAFVSLAALVLAYIGTLDLLAGATSVLILLVFSATNLSLIKVKKQKLKESESFTVPEFVPYLGLILTLGLVVAAPLNSILTAAALLVAGIVIRFALVRFATKVSRA